MEYGAGSDATAGALVALWTSMMCLMYLIPMVLGVASVVVWVIALVDVVQRVPEDFPNARAGRDDPNERMVWLLIVLLVGVIGAVVYYFIVMKPYPRKQPTAAVAPIQAQPETQPEPEPRPPADDTV